MDPASKWSGLDLDCLPMQGLFSGEIMRDLLTFMPKISLKFAKWEKKSHTKMKIPQRFC